MRPKKCRKTCCRVAANYFKPCGIPVSDLEIVVLEADEVEAIKLAHIDSLYQDQAATKMNISRPTFSRILDSAHKKIAEALIVGKALSLNNNQ